MSESINHARGSLWQLLVVTALIIVGYACSRSLRFTHQGLNLAFECVFLLSPFVAIRPMLRLPRWPKALGTVLLCPLLAISLLGLLALATCEVPDLVRHHEHDQELSTIQRAHYSVHLLWEETAGGAVGPHGVGLQQRMLVFPGLYAFKSLDYFEGAHEGSLTVETGDKVRLRIPRGWGYYHQSEAVDRVYSLKPWVYF